MQQVFLSAWRIDSPSASRLPLKILILKPSSLGDVVQALPVLRLLKKRFPRSEIFWWLDSRLVSLLEDDPDLAGVIPFERDALRSVSRWGRVWRSVREIRAHQFDWVIDLQALARSGIVAWLANGDLTIGLDDSREGAPLFYDQSVPRATRLTHAVDWYLSVLGRLGVPLDEEFDWMPRRASAVSAQQREWESQGQRWILLQPGARWMNKRWPVEHFQQLVREVVRDLPDVRCVVIGSGGEADLAKAIAEVAPEHCLNLAGATTLPEMVEWVRGGQLIVTNDTGPMHIAAALDRPVVAVFGPTEPRRTGPYGQEDQVFQADLPCVPCMKSTCRRDIKMECMHSILPGAVVQRLKALLSAESCEKP